MQAFFVVDLFPELADGRASVGQVAVFVAQHFFILQRFHERFAGRVIPRIALARILAMAQQAMTANVPAPAYPGLTNQQAAQLIPFILFSQLLSRDRANGYAIKSLGRKEILAAVLYAGRDRFPGRRAGREHGGVLFRARS